MCFDLSIVYIDKKQNALKFQGISFVIRFIILLGDTTFYPLVVDTPGIILISSRKKPGKKKVTIHAVDVTQMAMRLGVGASLMSDQENGARCSPFLGGVKKALMGIGSR